MSKSADEKNIAAAKAYVDKQLDTLKRYDSAPKNLSKEEYRHLIEDVADAIRLK
jgi:hypothetical protein